MRQRVTIPRLFLFLAEVIVFAILAVAATNHFGWADGARLTAAYLVAYLVPKIILVRARGSSTTACVILLLLAMFLMGLNYLRLTYYTSFEGYSLQLPNLQNDPRTYYGRALDYYLGREPVGRVAFPGFPLMMAGLWKVFGQSVIWPQAMNIMFTLTSVVLTGMITRRLLNGKVAVSPQALVTCGVLFTGSLIYYMAVGTLILKESSIYLSISLAGFALSSMAAQDNERYRLWRDILFFVLACLLMALVRTTYLYFIALGVIVITLPHWRRDWMLALFMLAVFFTALMVGDHYSSYSFGRHALIVQGGEAMQECYVISDSQRFYNELLDNYFLYSPMHRIAMLPFTMAVQFIIPFPWTFYEAHTFVNMVSRLTWGWYLVGGIAMFYYLFLSWRRRHNMGSWAWWPALSFAAIAYIMAGSVARYVLPIEPLFVPVAVFVLCRVYEGRYRKSFLAWATAFVIVLAAALLFYHSVQLGHHPDLFPGFPGTN